MEKTKDTTPKKKKTITVRVHRSNIDPENKDVPISVMVNSFANRRKFNPGQTIELEQKNIDALRASKDDTSIEIPFDSGIYTSENPKFVAENMYPGFSAVIDPHTGGIKMIKSVPNYIVEYV